ncbi:MAG: D-alanyl-D-alanine carboxypeptidase [Lactobacillus sp.]|nr:D-alanyl-D-alanine carboxypeptidase [Lactobacillus sp.]MDN6042842.1 D-alanyl-D-alanine carboxypeptidase [Lactobacillus sp.]MDN6051948.1 D-alanyl-D-alanine carboxypeptidase [Lactobacillus sp.]
MRKLKKLIISGLSLLAFALVTTGTPVSASSQPDVQADQLNLKVKSAMAIDAQTGQVLYAKNAGKVMPIASMTKLVTVYLTLAALKRGAINWQTKVRATKAIAKVANNADYSNVPLQAGHAYTIKQLYQATLIASANGAAMCLANAVAGNQVAFVKQMRALVKHWGLSDAKIYTVNGLPNGNLGSNAYPGVSRKAENEMSASDMATIATKLLHHFPVVLETTRIAKMGFVDGHTTTPMANWNWMLKGLSQYDNRYPLDGLKTGTTDAAGACFVGTLARGGSRIITVVMGAKHVTSSDPSRFVQTKHLLQYLFTHYRAVVIPSGQRLISLKVKDGHEKRVATGLTNRTTVWDPVDGKKLTAHLTTSEVPAPLKRGQVATTVQFKSGKTVLTGLNRPAGMRIPVAPLASVSEVNIFVKFWRFIFGG